MQNQSSPLPKGSLTLGQKESFARIQERSGMVVHVVRSVEQAVSAVQAWLGVENETRKEGDATCAAHADSDTEPGTTGTGALPSNNRPTQQSDAAPTFKPESAANLFIGNIGGKDYVLYGDSSPGSSASILRLATPADLINLPRG
jgi:hypothetical protein